MLFKSSCYVFVVYIRDPFQVIKIASLGIKVKTLFYVILIVPVHTAPIFFYFFIFKKAWPLEEDVVLR